MMHSPSRPSWIEHARISRASQTPEEQRRLALSVLSLSLILVALTVWFVVTFL
jgi:hypothetical protein